MSRYDRDDDDYGGPRRVPFPGTVMAAGVIWIGYGCLGVLTALATCALAGAAKKAGDGAAGLDLCLPFCFGGFAIAVLTCGLLAVTGRSPDTLGTGIGSVVLGFLQLGAATLMAFLIAFGWAWSNHDPRAVVVVDCGATVLLGPLLATAGVLALSGRGRYLKWREANASPNPSRRRDDD